MAESAPEETYEYGGRRLSAGQMAEIDEWVSRRPAERARSNQEVRQTLLAVRDLVMDGDLRCMALGKGVYFGAQWVSGETPIAPASARELPNPNFHEIATEIETAGRAAAGAQTFPNSSWCDEGRIAARGVEEWLVWLYTPAYPLPVWFIPGTPLDEVRWVLGDVGLDGPGRPGLRGLKPSQGRFAYDVADYVDGI